MLGVSKAFGGTQALDNVSFEVDRGEVHALLGENGAGKSTLMKIIMGLYRADAGEMEFEGRKITVRGPAEALSIGISMIHQELNPEPYLTVAENIFLKREHTRGKTPFLNKKQTLERTQEILDSFNFRVDPRAEMQSLTMAQMQMVEIIRAVSCNARLIIMDEPTSSLDVEETERLFRTIRELKAKGVSIVYISHRMEEIFEICDRVSVFRDGKYIATRGIDEVKRDELITLMVGRKVTNIYPKSDVPVGEEVFRAEGLCGNGFNNVSFSVRAGEILGFSGLVGSGRSETMRAIFGLDRLRAGRMFYRGRELRITSPGRAIKLGLSMVSEDRKLYGLVLSRPILENISLPSLPERQPKPLINHKRERREVGETAKSLTVKAASLDADAYSLSGGNQQKVVLCKWLMTEPKLLILDEPTRGVDVGAKAEIHRLMCEFAAQGMAILLISSELPEVMGMSDRILVYHEGRINGEVRREDILSGAETQETILGRAFGERPDT
ncbi:MAG: sugar ABC transporter ATP-binding protein [Clostridiales bacterium]|nr:sugar ABC transporter ATP-binding protein [Clostridiales bacterium]